MGVGAVVLAADGVAVPMMELSASALMGTSTWIMCGQCIRVRESFICRVRDQ